jgi:hypothetical protein
VILKKKIKKEKQVTHVMQEVLILSFLCFKQQLLHYLHRIPMKYHKMLNLKVTSSLFSKLVVVIFGQKIYLNSMVLMLIKTKVSPFLLHCFH